MTLWLLIPLLALTTLFQVALMPTLPFIGYKLDLPLMLIVAWGLIAPFGEAAEWGFVVGIFLDLASGLPFGIHAITMTIIGVLIGLGQTTFFRGNIIAPPVAMVIATLVNHLLILGILALLNWDIRWNDYLLQITLPTAILNAFAMPFIYVPLQRLQRRLHPRLEV